MLAEEALVQVNFFATKIIKELRMVKNKVIPILTFLAASFMLGAQPVQAESLEVAKVGHSIHREESGHHLKKHTRTECGKHNERCKAHKSKRVTRSSAYDTVTDNTNNASDYYIVTRTDDHEPYVGNQNQDNYTNYYEVTIEERPLEYIDISPIAHEFDIVRPNVVNRIDEVNNIRVNGSLPQIVGINERAAGRINERIRDSFINLINAGHRDITADFDVHNWGGITSIVVRYNMAGDREIVNTFVFDHVSKTEVTLRNLLGREFMTYVNNRISADLRNEDTNFANITNFRAIRANQNFYVKDGNIHIIFEQSRVAHQRYGVVEFILPIESLNYSLSSNQFIVKDGTVFVPATVARRFGMDVNLSRGGVMQIRNAERTININVHNEQKNAREVTYINGYDVALSSEFLRRELGIDVEKVPGAREVTVSHRFNR